jgi:hypothetical protein
MSEYLDLLKEANDILEGDLSQGKFNPKDLYPLLASVHKRISDFLQHKIKEGSCEHLNGTDKYKPCLKMRVVAEKHFQAIENLISVAARKLSS